MGTNALHRVFKMKTLITKGKLSVITLFLTSLNIPLLFANQNQYESDYFYVGAKVGSIRFQHACEPWAISCDKRHLAYGVFGGYQINQNFSFEISGLDLGEAEASYFESGLENNYVAEMKGWDLGLTYEFSLTGNSKSFAKVGFVNWHGKHKGPNESISEDDWSPSGTLGLKYNINDNWQARLAYQYIGELGNDVIGSSNGHIGWLGLSYQFKRNQQPAAQPITPAEKPQQIVEKKEKPAPVVVEKTRVVPAQSVTTLFAFDISHFEATPEFDDFISHITSYPTANITINAYTDSKGAAEYNKWLSKRRAEAIKANLIKNGISENRISIAFFGETNPVTDNDTADHRQLNRRAVITASEVEVSINEEVQ